MEEYIQENQDTSVFLDEDNETDIWKIICYNNDIKFDSSRTDSTEYQIMWNNYFKD